MLLPSAGTERVDFWSLVCQQAPLQYPKDRHDRKHLVGHRAGFQSAAVMHPPHLSVEKKKSVRHLRTSSQYAST
jgi:hypothetical protein